MDIKVETVEESSCPVKVQVGTLTIPRVNGEIVDLSTKDLGGSGEKKKRGRKKKVEVSYGAPEQTEDSSTQLPSPNQSYTMVDTPYHNSYNDTDRILKDAIMQLDLIVAQTQEDLTTLRASKTIRNKYSYISDMTSSMISGISAKVGAAKEINNSIKNAHQLDLQRMKELKLNEENKDDEKTIMDIYQAFISQPVSQNLGAFQSPLGASTFDLTTGAIPGMGGMMQPNMMGQNPDAGYNQYLNSMTPEQMTMMIEENPDMKHVIAYDQTTGNAEFAIYDQRNGQFIQGIPTRSKEMFMNGVDFDFNTMVAHSNDLNESYDIIFTNSQPQPGVNVMEQVNNNSDMSQY